MDRRRFLRVGVAGLAGVAGCSSTGDGGGRTVNPALRETPTDTPTATPTATPEPPAYGAGEADSLDRARSVHVRNRFVTPQWISLEIAESGRTAVERTVRVPPAGRVTFDGVIGAPRRYAVTVRTTDRRRGEFEWAPGPGDGDLEIDLGTTIAPRDSYPPSTASAFVVGTTDATVVGGAPSTTELVVDTPAEGGRLRVTAFDGEGSTGVDLRVPAASRVPVPLSLPPGAVSVAVETRNGMDRHEWVPDEDGTLVCLNDSSPRLVCDLLIRDLLLENDTDDDAGVDVEVVADDATVFDWRLYPVAGGSVRVPTVVPPAGRYVVGVEHGDDETRRRLRRCPARGPIVVRLTDDGVEVGSRPVE